MSIGPEHVLRRKDDVHASYDAYKPVLSAILYGIESKLKKTLVLASMPTFKSRVKEFNSYFRKVLRIKPQSFETEELPVLTDLLGIRVICAFLEDLKAVEQQIVENFEILEIERKGDDRTFSEFGYESVHILIGIPEKMQGFSDSDKGIKLPEGLVCEIQIRTILQDAWAEVEHELVYKSDFSPFDLPLRRKLASMNASLSLADIVFQEIRDYQNKLNSELALRRNAFYEKADEISREKFSEGNSDTKTNIEYELKPSSSKYVKGTIDDMILEAIHSHNNGDLPKAIYIYTQIISSKPEPNNIVLSVIYKHRGMAYFAQNNYKEALSDFISSVEQDKKNFRSYYYAGIASSLMKNDIEAIEWFTKSLQINLYQSHVYYRRALSYYNMGDNDKALEDLTEANKLGLEDDDSRKLYEAIKAKKEMF